MPLPMSDFYPKMFSSSNSPKGFSLSNIIEEQLSNISLGNQPINVDTDNNDLGLDVNETCACPSIDPQRRLSSVCRDADKLIETLFVSEVRWFYKDVGKTWSEFSGYDSLQIETTFRTLPIEYQEKRKKINTTSCALSDTDPLEEPACLPKVLVLGGLYEVDFVTNSCLSIYWPGEVFPVMRGTWFYETTWQPLEEDFSSVIETSHLLMYMGKKGADFPVDNHTKVAHTEAFSDFHVDWYSPVEVYLYSKGTPSKIVRSFTKKLGYFQRSTGTRLVRGYKEKATGQDKPKDITHLVFVVHGIGQKMNIGAQIFRNTTSIRDRVAAMKKRHFPDCEQRVEFFPVEWRMGLTLDAGTVDAITPPCVMMLRQILNTSAMDVMYYTSPLYCSEIQSCLVAEMNRLYSMYKERHPNSTPKISVIAHSLGSVIVYDVVTGWLPMGTSNDVLIPGKSRLNFELDNFFCLGSPLSVFLALRVPKEQHGYHLFPPTLCNRLYNIYHANDLVAYRLEPLIVKDYARISPLHIHSHSAIRPIPYSEISPEVLGPDLNSSIVESCGANSDPSTSTSPVESPNKEKSWSVWNLVRGAQKSQDSSGSPHHSDSPTQGLEHRLDYVLKSGSGGPMVFPSVLLCHTSYWNNDDVAYFVLTRIFPEFETRPYGAEDKASSSIPARSSL